MSYVSVGRRPPDLIDFHGIRTQAPQLREVLRLIARVARVDCTVLVTGETGTGKELVARAIHQRSPRSAGPFLARNCATLSPTLLESELFGHVRGAFTGAIRDKKGVFALAHKGTLLLDEIAETSLEIQGRLLRVIQEKVYTPVGAIRSERAEVRLISATNKSLIDEVAAGRFRADLTFRMRVVPLFLPPLRHRTGDAEALFLHFIRVENERTDLRRVDAVTEEALAAVRSYTWPGNVRELQSAVEYAFVVGEGRVLGAADLPPEVRGESALESQGYPRGGGSERDRLLEALERCRWRRDAAAAALGISRSTLWRRMRESGIHGAKRPL